MNKITLVRSGKPFFYLSVWHAMDGHFLRAALTELREHLRDCLGKYPVWYNRAENGMVCLSLEFRPNEDISSQGFKIVSCANRIRLVGRNQAGLFNAIYYFLETAFGVRWLWPGESGKVTPKAMEVSWPEGIEVHIPSFLWRRQGTGGSFWREMDVDLAQQVYAGITTDTAIEFEKWHQRMRLGGLNIADGHRWAEICPPQEYGDTHPEYYALYEGKRDCIFYNGKHANQPCTTNPEVIKITSDYIIAQFDARPELDGFSITLNDGIGFCECKSCQDFDKWASENATHEQTIFDEVVKEWAPGGSGGVVTDRIMKFANDVAECVAERYPDKFLLMLVYSFYRNPPKRVKLHPNVITQFASMSYSWADENIAEDEKKSLAELAGKSKRVGFYDYLVNGANGSMPRGYARILNTVLKDFYRIGGRYYATQPGMDFALSALGYYVMAKTLWDVDSDFDVICEDFCQSGFGPASDTVKSYLLAFCKRWEETKGARLLENAKCMEQQVLALYPDDWFESRRIELTRAAKLCSGDTNCLDRIRFLQKGLMFLEKLGSACKPAVELFENLPYTQPFDSEIVTKFLKSNKNYIDKINNAVSLRDSFLIWAHKNRNQFIYTEVWFEYQRQTRGGLLGIWLDNLAANVDHD